MKVEIARGTFLVVSEAASAQTLALNHLLGRLLARKSTEAAACEVRVQHSGGPDGRSQYVVFVPEELWPHFARELERLADEERLAAGLPSLKRARRAARG